MKKWLLLGLLLCYPYTATAYEFDDWTRGQLIMQGLTTFSYVLDWGQTLDIENHSNLYETNFLLGDHPSRGEINTYFASLILTHILITHVLPSEYRMAWLTGTFMISVGYVNNNYHLGLTFKW